MATKLGQYALPLSGAPGPRTAGGGGSPKAVIAHHTSGRGTPEGIVKFWQSERPGIGSQYIIDRDGNVIDTKSLGHTATGHIKPGKGPEGAGLENKNVVGYEIIAKDDSDITPAQRKAFKEHTDKNYPDVPVKGHGAINPHKEETEGDTAVKDVKESRDALAKVADVTKAGGQYALPARETMIAALGADPGPQQYALPKMAEDPMTADAGAPSRPGYNYPSKVTPETKAVIENVANRYGLRPDAVAGLVDTESKWNPEATSPKGTYRGLTQIGPDTFKEAGGKLGGMTFEQFKSAAPEQQLAAYGDWLQHYNFADKVAATGVNLPQMSAAEQAAYLQGFQFGPNAIGWQSAYGQGNDTVRSTTKKQADVLGDNSMRQMTAYYDKVMGKGEGQKDTTPDVDRPTAVATATQPKASAAAAKGFATAAKALDPEAKTNQYALPKSTTAQPKVESAMQAAGAVANALADGVSDRRTQKEYFGAGADQQMDRKMAALKASPLAEPPPGAEKMPEPAKPPPAQPAEPAAKVAEAPKADPFAIAEPFGPLSQQQQQPAAKPPELALPPPPVIPKGVEMAQIADPFSVSASSFAPEPYKPPPPPSTEFANLFGDTPNAGGGAVGKDMLAALAQRANENMVRDTAEDAPKLEQAPATPAQGSGGGAGGSGVEVAGLTDGTERFGSGVIVPPVHTPLDFSAINASINAPVNPLQGVNMSSPAFWFNNNPLGM